MDFTFHFHSLKKEMATHSSVLAWRIPGMGEPGRLLSVGSHRVGHDWSNLSSSSRVCKKKQEAERYFSRLRCSPGLYGRGTEVCGLPSCGTSVPREGWQQSPRQPLGHQCLQPHKSLASHAWGEELNSTMQTGKTYISPHRYLIIGGSLQHPFITDVLELHMAWPMGAG